MTLPEFPHRRFNPLTGEWVLVSPHRTQRPWQGGTEPTDRGSRNRFDPHCYLCPGNVRANGDTNPTYEDCYVFDNDFAALLPEGESDFALTNVRASASSPDAGRGESDFALTNVRASASGAGGSGLLKAETVGGTCRVVCFSPRHDLTLASMEVGDIRRVVDTWAAQAAELGTRYKWVQIFENKGEVMGCSNPHPHGQIWASDALPNEAAKEDANQKSYGGGNLLLDYLETEIASGERVIIQNADWAVVVPFWAVWPFETLLLPKRHVQRIDELGFKERDSLAEILKQLLAGYDKVFDISFPYTMGWHGAPFGDDDDTSHWQLHAHFYPPLLRSATVKKFMVGYEMLAEPQRDITPEAAAKTLRTAITKNF